METRSITLNSQGRTCGEPWTTGEEVPTSTGPSQGRRPEDVLRVTSGGTGYRATAGQSGGG